MPKIIDDLFAKDTLARYLSKLRSIIKDVEGLYLSTLAGRWIDVSIVARVFRGLPSYGLHAYAFCDGRWVELPIKVFDRCDKIVYGDRYLELCFVNTSIDEDTRVLIKLPPCIPQQANLNSSNLPIAMYNAIVATIKLKIVIVTSSPRPSPIPLGLVSMRREVVLYLYVVNNPRIPNPWVERTRFQSNVIERDYVLWGTQKFVEALIKYLKPRVDLSNVVDLYGRSLVDNAKTKIDILGVTFIPPPKRRIILPNLIDFIRPYPVSGKIVIGRTGSNENHGTLMSASMSWYDKGWIKVAAYNYSFGAGEYEHPKDTILEIGMRFMIAKIRGHDHGPPRALSIRSYTSSEWWRSLCSIRFTFYVNDTPMYSETYFSVRDQFDALFIVPRDILRDLQASGRYKPNDDVKLVVEMSPACTGEWMYVTPHIYVLRYVPLRGLDKESLKRYVVEIEHIKELSNSSRLEAEFELVSRGPLSLRTWVWTMSIPLIEAAYLVNQPLEDDVELKVNLSITAYTETYYEGIENANVAVALCFALYCWGPVFVPIQYPRGSLPALVKIYNYSINIPIPRWMATFPLLLKLYGAVPLRVYVELLGAESVQHRSKVKVFLSMRFGYTKMKFLVRPLLYVPELDCISSGYSYDAHSQDWHKLCHLVTHATLKGATLKVIPITASEPYDWSALTLSRIRYPLRTRAQPAYLLMVMVLDHKTEDVGSSEVSHIAFMYDFVVPEKLEKNIDLEDVERVHPRHLSSLEGSRIVVCTPYEVVMHSSDVAFIVPKKKLNYGNYIQLHVYGYRPYYVGVDPNITTSLATASVALSVFSLILPNPYSVVAGIIAICLSMAGIVELSVSNIDIEFEDLDPYLKNAYHILRIEGGGLRDAFLYRETLRLLMSVKLDYFVTKKQESTLVTKLYLYCLVKSDPYKPGAWYRYTISMETDLRYMFSGSS